MAQPVTIIVIPGSLLLVFFGVLLLAAAIFVWLRSRHRHASSRRHSRARGPRTA
jgi:uncharacterized membrane protein YfcA